jgi:hypothetical protein
MRIFWILVFIAACIGGYYVWQHYSPKSQMTDGAVHWEVGQPTAAEKAAFDKENSGDTPDGNSEHKTLSARQEAANIANPTASPTAPSAGNPVPSSAATAPAATTYPSAPAATPANLPTMDSQSPNAPNGVRFGGSGNYQWYRQGNLTYRIDTVTGSSCIAYATLEEWRKQIVYSHGCGRGA